jgi:AcrR family transcriptional regulator
MGLAREKPCPSIAVKEIPDRATVGRSTFYTHFRNKDDRLETGIHEILRCARVGEAAHAGLFDTEVRFGWLENWARDSAGPRKT